MMNMSDKEAKRIDVRDIRRFLSTFGGIKVAYDGARPDVRAFYDKIEGQKSSRGTFFEGKKLTDIFIYAMCLGKSVNEPRNFEIDDVTGKTDRRATIDLEYFANQPEYVWMMVSVALNDTKDSKGNPTMDIFREPRKIIEICEKYANGGISDLIAMASNFSTDDQHRGYAKKLRELIASKKNENPD
jgi:hypothetical protein